MHHWENSTETWNSLTEASEQRGYSQPTASSLSGTMLSSLSLLFRLPPADSPTVKAASGRSRIYPSWRQTCRRLSSPQLQARGASWHRCDGHVKPCGAAGAGSIKPQVSGPFCSPGRKLFSNLLNVCLKKPQPHLSHSTYTSFIHCIKNNQSLMNLCDSNNNKKKCCFIKLELNMSLYYISGRCAQVRSYLLNYSKSVQFNMF